MVTLSVQIGQLSTMPARLDQMEARIDGRIGRIEDKIEKLDGKVGDLSGAVSDASWITRGVGVIVALLLAPILWAVGTDFVTWTKRRLARG
jgi:hypothetical protein